MSETENGPDEPQKIQRASERKRAYRLRKKAEDQRTDDEKAWLADYESTKRGAAKVDVVDTEPESPDPGTGNDEPAIEAPSFTAPPPPPPPRVSANVNRGDSDESHGSTGTGWKRKYQGGSNGREKTVLVVASQWRGLLQFMSDQIVMSGGTPLVKIDDLWPAMVMTVDDFLPEKVAIKPAHIALGGTTVLLAQRVMRHKKIGEAYAAGGTTVNNQPGEPVTQSATPVDVPNPPPDEAPPTTPEPAPVNETPSVPAPLPPVISLASDVVIDHADPTQVY